MIKTAIKNMAEGLGYSISRTGTATGEAVPPQVHAFLRQMWPVVTTIPLIRCGGSSDGAYLLPNDLDGIAALFSPGVDVVANFERDLAARGLRCYLADGSVVAPPLANDAFTFDAKFIGLCNNESTTTMDSWVGNYEAGSHDLILQMDIEGAEWPVLSGISDDLLRRFRIILVEVHSLGQLLNQYGRQTVIETLGRILESHYLVHHHPNNWGGFFCMGDVKVPDVSELTFLRKDRADLLGYATVFPHPLDIVNAQELPRLQLPKCWHASA